MCHSRFACQCFHLACFTQQVNPWRDWFIWRFSFVNVVVTNQEKGVLAEVALHLDDWFPGMQVFYSPKER